MDERFLLREFRDEDFLEVIKLWEESGVGGAHRGDDLSCIHNTLAQKGKILLLEDPKEGEVAACCWLTYDGRRLYLHHLAVRTSYHRNGLGKYLTECAIEYAKSLKAQLKLEVATANAPAINLYKNSGFEVLPNHQVMLRRDTQS